MALLLASASPRRKELLQMITGDFMTVESGFDESNSMEKAPKLLAQRLAQSKCHAVAVENPGDTVIGCDTVVELDGKVFGKPQSREEAKEMLLALSGQQHKVHTGVCLCHEGREVSFVETTSVWFSEIPPEELEAYLDTDEPYDKAGGYGIQGWAARFIPKIEGCYFNVMGLPVARLYAALAELKK